MKNTSSRKPRPPVKTWIATTPFSEHLRNAEENFDKAEGFLLALVNRRSATLGDIDGKINVIDKFMKAHQTALDELLKKSAELLRFPDKGSNVTFKTNVDKIMQQETESIRKNKKLKKQLDDYRALAYNKYNVLKEKLEAIQSRGKDAIYRKDIPAIDQATRDMNAEYDKHARSRGKQITAFLA